MVAHLDHDHSKERRTLHDQTRLPTPYNYGSKRTKEAYFDLWVSYVSVIKKWVSGEETAPTPYPGDKQLRSALFADP
jgi:hypothetical protein